MLNTVGVGWGPLAKRQARMTIRSRHDIVSFKHPFRVSSVDLAGVQRINASVAHD